MALRTVLLAVLVPGLALGLAAARPRAAVAVVTYERPEYLARCLRLVAVQTYPEDLVDVVVIDDSATSCRPRVEAILGASLDDMFGGRLDYVYLEGRTSIGAKRRLAVECLAATARGRPAVAVTWDDDDVYGEDRLAAQLAPIASGLCDATVATPCAWVWEAAPGDAVAADMAWPLVPLLIFAVDGECALGLELLDEAIASLCFRIDLHDADTSYPDTSYDEDRDFLRKLKRRGVAIRRLAPGAPLYRHVKHQSAASAGPLTRLYGAGLGFAASPPVAAVGTLGAVYGAARLVAELKAHFLSA
ncbi:hypothetical protein M885DRAFT_552027 [Pelagophyceae sp. CCMP2097]|nr:hypothetical protein M885DRAFT_552027 [Pelagophyceae sp. CCMP2097]|mmetsp:Transcript_20873/g.71812  ORF Transcript_20873/g.71812 Transcript_20873/m.71812 type:complete len:303 (-) Transcript_20873:19-927(-)